MALLNIAMMDAAISCWMLNIPTLIQDLRKQILLKNNYWCPKFSAYLDIHFSAAAKLCYLISFHLKEPLTKQWQSKPLTRLYGAIHYRDCEKGLIW
jgi:hypothetical protein